MRVWVEWNGEYTVEGNVRRTQRGARREPYGLWSLATVEHVRLFVVHDGWHRVTVLMRPPTSLGAIARAILLGMCVLYARQDARMNSSTRGGKEATVNTLSHAWIRHHLSAVQQSIHLWCSWGLPQNANILFTTIMHEYVSRIVLVELICDNLIWKMSQILKMQW